MCASTICMLRPYTIQRETFQQQEGQNARRDSDLWNRSKRLYRFPYSHVIHITELLRLIH
jgi:hypothetical protein